MAQLAGVSAENGHPYLHEKERDAQDALDLVPRDAPGAVRPQHRHLHDPSVTFEEYYHYAQLTRAEEDRSVGGETGILSIIFPSKNDKGVQRTSENVSRDASKINTSDLANRLSITDEEWTNASRALRTASRGAIFYLITTDIMGPFVLPYAFATMGWGPGIALYTVFAGLAGYSGYLLWQTFLGLDSYQYPLHSFGDIGFRLYGPWMRHLCNMLASIQLVLNVGVVIIINGEALSQVTRFRLCFIICCLVWALVGSFLGQVRTLQKFGWLTNAAIWANILWMLITMGGAAHSPPNFTGSSQSAGAGLGSGASVKPINGVYPPITTSRGLPEPNDLGASLNGAMQAVFAYGGSMVFPEFMAEMKRPKDFLTVMWAAQAFIYFCYMFYGLFMYGHQGQYTINPSYLGVSQYGLQTAGNVLAMTSAVISAGLLGNIGLKVVYTNIFVEFFKAPPLTTRAGKWAWVGLNPIYWSIAFVLASAIPNFSGLTSVVAVFCNLQFTYTFPPILATLFWVKEAAFREGEGFDPATGVTVRHDSGVKRIVRGFLSQSLKRLVFSVFNVFYLFGALTLAGLGAYSAITSLADAYRDGVTTSFVCTSPLENA